jgi:hypothetical protein
MPRKRAPGAPTVVLRTARCGLRATPAQRGRVFGLLRSAGDAWCCVLDLNRWRRQRGDERIKHAESRVRIRAESRQPTFPVATPEFGPVPVGPPNKALISRGLAFSNSTKNLRVITMPGETGFQIWCQYGLDHLSAHWLLPNS